VNIIWVLRSKISYNNFTIKQSYNSTIIFHFPMKKNESAILLIHCPDKKGIIRAVTDFLYENNGNVVYLDQHTDHSCGEFFMRIEWEIEGFQIGREKIGEYFETLIARKFNMSWTLHFSDQKKRVAVFVTKL